MTSSQGQGAGQEIDLTAAKQFFEEAKTVSDHDGGSLWGVELYGPMLFVDPTSRAAVANQPDLEGRLKRNADVYTGRLPAETNIANTALDWAGRKWTTLLWPLPESQIDRASLVMHELFHRVQNEVGLPPSNSLSAHLDEKQGRILIQLEWRALVEALRLNGQGRRDAIADALIFRNYRSLLYPGADTLESSLELNEGLAEYTGVTLSGRSRPELLAHLSKKVDEAASLPGFVRSFAYISGPLYGILLDEGSAIWRHKLAADTNLGTLLGRIYGIKPMSSNLERKVAGRSAAYGKTQIEQQENDREAKHERKVDGYVRRFVKGPVVTMPLGKMNIQFNPNNLFALDSLGTVYPTIRVADLWGILTVTGGALVSADWTRICVSAELKPRQTTGTSWTGDGWNLEIKPGWKMVAAAKRGNLILK